MTIAIQEYVQLKPYNTMALSAVARYFVTVSNDSDFPEVVRFAKHKSIPLCVLGDGSNVIFRRDYPGIVVLVRNKGIEIIEENDHQVIVCVAAGEKWDEFLQYCLSQGWYGLENLAIIPGSVGASPVQNVGAYGQEVADCIEAVRIFDMMANEEKTLSSAVCEFSYRDSIFKRQLKDVCVITSVIFRFAKTFVPNVSYGVLASMLGSDTITAQQVREAVISIRQAKLPAPDRLANCGSFFKNPVVPKEKQQSLLLQFPGMPSHVQSDGTVKLAAGWLIEKAGWRGRRLGGVGMYQHQALVLVNYGDASYGDLHVLVAAVQHDVAQMFGVQLEQEPVLV